MIYIGEFRVGNDAINFLDLVKKIFVQNTASDVAYVFNSSINYNKNNELLKGKTYVTYLVKTIPLLDYSYRVENILQEQYNTPGGDFFLDEPLMNFGIIGIIIYPIIELGIYYLILKKHSDYSFFVWIFLMATSFRTSWYGLLYIEKGIIYFIPIIYIIVKMFNSNKVGVRYGNNNQ